MDRSTPIVENDPARKTNPGMPNHVATDAAFIAAVEAGLADVESGRTVPFEGVAAELRRASHKKA